MAYFEYKVSDREGKTSSGQGEAASREAMVDSLINGGFFVIDIREVQKGRRSGVSGLAEIFFSKVSAKEITYFYMQLSTLINAGVTLVESLDSLADQCDNLRFKAVIVDVKTRVSTGQSFNEALARHPDVFDDLAVNMIKAGETGAGLDEVLTQIAKFSERDTKLRSKVKSAMIYPATLCVLATSVVIFLVVYVFPKFAKVFAKAKTALPGPTLVLMTISNFLQAYYAYILVFAAVGLFFSRWMFVSSAGFKTKVDYWSLKIPVFGNLMLKSAVARFTRTLGTLLNGGVPIIRSLEICENIVSNDILKNVVASMKSGVAQGLTLYDILRTKKVFPGIVTKIIQTGEKTGALPKLLIKASDFFEYEVEILIESIMTIIEPILIIIMGIVVGFIAIAMFLPMFDITSTIR